MRKLIPLACFIIGLLCLSACKQKDKHFLTNEAYRNQVHKQFLKRKELASNRSQQLFTVFEQSDLTTQQREALEFLYAYMPLSDLADYDGAFFLSQVDAAFRAKEYFSWGKSIPEAIFRHFVLPHRVNNENLDNAREVFFDELKDRISGMTMEQAALEVNHWCHEKVTYRATDGRTSAPLALAKTSWGRCGEESTFTVTALRSVGIPARQCYTPRWAHTDSNHAWVEVWIDGKWRFMGACEPEEELDIAWFNAPVQRAMMVHTNVFGLYKGEEEKNLKTDLYSTINVLETYAPTRKVNVQVVNASGQPVENATVKYKVYNYAEFYPLCEQQSKADGTSSIISGMGDILVWASKGDAYGYAKSTPKDELVTVSLNRKPGETYEETFTMEPPIEREAKKTDPEKAARNAIRLVQEDSIRNAYMTTFIQENKADELAKQLGLSKDDVWRILSTAQGNWEAIQVFMTNNSSNPNLNPYLNSLWEKDLRDTPAEYLNNHLANGATFGYKESYKFDHLNSYVHSPRIALELIRPWRNFLQAQFSEAQASDIQKDVQLLVTFVKEHVSTNNDENYYRCPLSPQGVYELKVADSKSRDIFFVALCRSLGIASRLDPATAKPQYYEKNRWVDVAFEVEKTVTLDRGTVTFTNAAENVVKPGYSNHYTLAVYNNGDFETLSFRNEKTLNQLPGSISIAPGYYRLTIAGRASDGSVTVTTRYFTVNKDDKLQQKILLPKTEGKLQLLGGVDMNTKVTLNDGKGHSLKELANGKGLVLCFADPDKEPTKHILQDLPQQKAELENWGGGILFMVPDDKLSAAFNANAFKGLPGQLLWGTDSKRELLNTIVSSLQLDFTDSFPLVVYLTNNGGIIFKSQGYKIGIGEDVLKAIKMETKTNETK